MKKFADDFRKTLGRSETIPERALLFKWSEQIASSFIFPPTHGAGETVGRQAPKALATITDGILEQIARRWYEVMKERDEHHFQAHYTSSFDWLPEYTYQMFRSSEMVTSGLEAMKPLFAVVAEESR